MLERKPRHGAPCNRCGLCCYATLCDLGTHVFQAPKMPGPCPALMRVGENEYACGLATSPELFPQALPVVLQSGSPRAREAALLILASGTGCDARFNGEPSDDAFNERMAAWDNEHDAEVRAAWRTWGCEVP